MTPLVLYVLTIFFVLTPHKLIPSGCHGGVIIGTDFYRSSEMLHVSVISGKQTGSPSDNCKPPDYKFYLSKLTNKDFPHKVQC